MDAHIRTQFEALGRNLVTAQGPQIADIMPPMKLGRKDDKRVFVLGAGFTRALFPSAPLMVAEFGAAGLAGRFASFPRAAELLELERSRHPEGHIDIERLMTRLDEGMPFDSTQGGEEQLRLLFAELKKELTSSLEQAKAGPRHDEELRRFAAYAVSRSVDCITFNYDDTLDEALWSVTRNFNVLDEPYWHPDGGYGFFCYNSMICIEAPENISMDVSSPLLLKLHGSVNWRPKRGSPRPYAIDAIVHHQRWFPILDPGEGREFLPPNSRPRSIPTDFTMLRIEQHLEAEPFLVPPVLMKTDLVRQPILRLVWSAGYDSLRQASEVIFVGYSMPITDLAAHYLFAEALDGLPRSKIEVVNPTNDFDRLVENYRRVFGDVTEVVFTRQDALAWIKTLPEVAEQVPLPVATENAPPQS